ncbi:MAG: type IV pilus assembly protein PilM [Planctomycetes bacterium]|nr:type IV pilus assembly protein PilM [Planctomycetota bacterium]
MAKSTSVWGVDIGQCAIKALRCSRVGDQIVADAFDYIEYPKILSQPDEADPKQLVAEALEQFLSRNDVKGHKIAISVPGQAGLARFFKPPPVDAKKIPDIVKFEARQVIPFALEEVIWDYQLMGGTEVDGFTIDAEVGLFAMKRDQVFRAIEPFTKAGIEIDIVQLAPLGIFNFVTHDLLARNAEYDPDQPPPSMVVLALGTDSTDLVVTNGFRVWQRSIPLGGNHFTKQLTKELKITFAKAEHLKRNARQADDPKRVFQAMRPVFNDLVTEVQRSVSYFQNIDRKAKIEGVVILGNTVKLPGLKPYLEKNLGYDVVHFEYFRKLDESAVATSPAFKDNRLSFGVAYGLCLQGLDASKLRTNLIPREMVVERMVRAKKPWAVASVAALLLACAFNFFFYYSVWYRVNGKRKVGGVSWADAEAAVDQIKGVSQQFETTDKEKIAKKQLLERIGDEVVGNADRRILWLELITALNQALPRTPGVEPGTVPDPKVVPYGKRQEIHIESIETQYMEDLATWWTDPMKQRYEEGKRVMRGEQPATASGSTDGSSSTTSTATAGATETAALTGDGWIIEFDGYHFFNEEVATAGPAHLYNTIIKYLDEGTVAIPNPKAGGEMIPFATKEIGIQYPVLVFEQEINKNYRIPNPNYSGPAMGGGLGGGGLGGGEPASGAPGGFTGPPGGLPGGPGGFPSGPGGFPSGPGGFPSGPGGFGGGAGKGSGGGSGAVGPGGASGGTQKGEDDPDAEPPSFPAPRYNFRIQFCWQPKLLTKRLLEKEEEARKQAEEAERKAADEKTKQGGDPMASDPPAPSN